ncbi:thioredoxin family protein [Idiomarina tyrosinivorans]|uniref:Thioredoxin family protein n=1 Tax=Idiomarina tyrosinivorans TaxID=1445662 RepID=A0A432ZTT4_9GAMM|nr:glutaredoxin family protein [Idiomarina tyrosinivorans]RUO81299.1 thioredoxin family protein [Idiomarina tyrosinivorans]
MQDFYLLTKQQCPLCTEALKLINQQPLEEPIRLHVVDIAEQPELQEEYAWLVPVLVRASDDSELRWPFAEQLGEFLQV